MDVRHDGLPGRGLAIATAPLQLRDEAPTTTGSHTVMATPSSTISPYNTGLNGVNQPVNMLFTDILWWSLGIVGMVMLVIRTIPESIFKKLKL